jgi:hypothetical protein
MLSGRTRAASWERCKVATRPVNGGALRPSNRLAGWLAIALALAIGSAPVALVAVGSHMEAPK